MLKSGVTLEVGCILGDKVVVGPNVKLAPHTKVSAVTTPQTVGRLQVTSVPHLPQPPPQRDETDEDAAGEDLNQPDFSESSRTSSATASSVKDPRLGEEGYGFVWAPADDAEEDARYTRWETAQSAAGVAGDNADDESDVDKELEVRPWGVAAMG